MVYVTMVSVYMILYGMKLLWPNLRYYSDIFLKGQMKSQSLIKLNASNKQQCLLTTDDNSVSNLKKICISNSKSLVLRGYNPRILYTIVVIVRTLRNN